MKATPLCVVCLKRPMGGFPLCEPCGRSYDRQIEKDETTAAIIEWAAKRARAQTKRRALLPGLPANFSGRYCLECRTPLTTSDMGKDVCPYCGVA